MPSERDVRRPALLNPAKREWSSLISRPAKGPILPDVFLLRTFGIVAGGLVGALPFWLIALVRTGERWPSRVALAVSLILSGMAFRTPRAWALGVAIGVVMSWASLAILAGTDWRLLPYVLLLFDAHYLGSIAVMFSVYFLMRARQAAP